MDLCLCNMEEYIKMRKNNLSIEEIRELLNQLNKIFKTMNEQNIIHRDIKPENILIDLKEINKCVIKLSDYGSCKINNNTEANDSWRNSYNNGSRSFRIWRNFS